MEFITLISSEANEISEKEAKKTIACDHITKALDTLGFGDYVPAVLEAAAHHKDQQKVIKNIVSTQPRSGPIAQYVTNDGNSARTSSKTVACRWRSWNGCRQSNSPKQRPDITKVAGRGRVCLCLRR